MHADYTVQRHCALFTGPTPHFIQKKILKMGSMVLFTHLKIILLQYFQFSAKEAVSKWTVNLNTISLFPSK